jgi:hypothetical protein
MEGVPAQTPRRLYDFFEFPSILSICNDGLSTPAPGKRDQMATFFNGPGESVVKRGERFWR